MALRHLVSIDDLSNEEILVLFEHARRMEEDLRGWADTAPGFIMASLFYEPSTRTRLSFESAMRRLGGGVVTSADMRQSSVAKGETLADTVRVVGGAVADVVVLRHPNEGAARVAADYSSVPVINAGDGSHEHPTQTLCDLYTLWREKGHIEGLDVVMNGDLRYSRTIHSFCFALARLGASIVACPHPGYELPEYVTDRLKSQYGNEPVRCEIEDLKAVTSGGVDAAYFTPQRPHQLSLFTGDPGEVVAKLDALYMTRPQTERFADGEATDTRFPSLSPDGLQGARVKDIRVMHPLPRTDEISFAMDEDPRSVYFQQAARGVPVRMAVTATLLGQLDLGVAAPAAAGDEELFENAGGCCCPNTNCITNAEASYLVPRFRVRRRTPLMAECRYCESRLEGGAVGCRSTRRYHRTNASAVRKIAASNLVLFESPEQAQARGYSGASGD